MSLISPWRADFPGILSLHDEGQTYLDSAATAQKPQAVLDALRDYYGRGAANVHRAQHLPAQRATQAFEGVREQLAGWLCDVLDALEAGGSTLTTVRDRVRELVVDLCHRHPVYR